MKHFLLIVLLFSSFLSPAQSLPPNVSVLPDGKGGTTGELKDRFYLYLNATVVPEKKDESITLYVNTACTDRATSDDAQLFSANPKWKFASIGIDSNSGNDVLLKSDKRGKGTYDTNYYVDFPLSVQLQATTEYELRLGHFSTITNKAMVVVRLFDSQYPDRFINLLEKDYRYQFTSVEGEGSKRFTVRVYAANLLKETLEDSNWTNPNNWIAGKVPGLEEGEDAERINNCVVIPEGEQLEIPNGKHIIINTLLNSGDLTIAEGASLTVGYEAQLAPFDSMLKLKN